jgi:hypothetical protein
MNKLKLIALFFSLTISALFAQRKNRLFTIGDAFPIAIGVNYEKIKDAYATDVYYNNGNVSNFSTLRGRLTIDLLYELSKRWKMESSLGYSGYHPSFNISRTATSPPYSIVVDTHSNNLAIAQKLMFDLLNLPYLNLYREIYVPASGSLRFTLSPYIAMEYEQFLSKRKRVKGYDLSTPPNLPAYSAEIKMPFGILSAIGGLSLEALLFKKIGVSYDFGYHHSLLGRTQIDAQYLFKYNEIHTVTGKSEKGGIIFKGRLRYYF